jgi:hypothetical protein
MGRQCVPSRTSARSLFMDMRPRALPIYVNQIVNGLAVRPDVTPQGAVVSDRGDHNFPQSILVCERWRNVMRPKQIVTLPSITENVMYISGDFLYYLYSPQWIDYAINLLICH